MTVRLRTNRWQVAAIALGWVVFAVVATFGFSDRPSLIGVLLAAAVLGYMAWTYPLSCVVTGDAVHIRSLVRTRSVVWSQVVAVRRAKGAWRHTSVGGRRRLRPAPGAPVLVLGTRRTVLMLGHAESRADNQLLVAAVESSSAALADSLRLTPMGRQ